MFSLVKSANSDASKFSLAMHTTSKSHDLPPEPLHIKQSKLNFRKYHHDFSFSLEENPKSFNEWFDFHQIFLSSPVVNWTAQSAEKISWLCFPVDLLKLL